MTLPPAWPPGWGQVHHDEIDSTMAEAARLAPAAALPLWISAGRQTAARGRRGRPWASPAGNLSATLLMAVAPEAPAAAALRSFVAALALHDALCAVGVPAATLALKWPNDVLMGGGKVAGILLELLPGARLAVGIGVNLAWAPPAAAVEPGALPPVALAGAAGLAVSPATMLTALAAAFARWEPRLRRDGFAPVRRAWLARAGGLGREITARTATEVLRGRFETLDDNGHLILDIAGRRRAIAAAEVFLPAI